MDVPARRGDHLPGTRNTLRLQGGFTGGNVDVDGSVSSQFLTALLMTALCAGKMIRIKGDLVSKLISIFPNLMATLKLGNWKIVSICRKGAARLRALIIIKAMSSTSFRQQQNQRRHRGDRLTQQYAGDIHDVRKNTPFAGAMIIFPHAW